MKTQKNSANLNRTLAGIALIGMLLLVTACGKDEFAEPSTCPDIEKPDTTNTTSDLPFVLESFANYLMNEAHCTQNPNGLTVFEPYVLTVNSTNKEENAISIRNFADIGHSLDATLRDNTIVIPVQAFAVGEWRYRVRGTGSISYNGVDFQYVLDAVGPNGKETIACSVEGKRL